MIGGRRWRHILKARRHVVGGSCAPPSREVSADIPISDRTRIDTTAISDNVPICHITPDGEKLDGPIGEEVPTEGLTDDEVFTRKTEPFLDARVERVLKEVTIGNGLTPEERLQAEALIRKYADCFALSVSEVHAVEGAVHKLNIPASTEFPKHVHQRPLTPPQKQFFHKKIEEM
ncbi:hypothetical protein K435DRAFT_700622, partial [Dendrothele bispora CBS 962.96]